MALGLMLTCITALSISAQDVQRISGLPRHIPLGEEACFERVYDAAHLKKHPKQRVTAFHVFRVFRDLADMALKGCALSGY